MPGGEVKPRALPQCSQNRRQDLNLGLHDGGRMKQQEKGHFKWREASLSKGMGGEDRSCFKEFLSSKGCSRGF